MRAQVGQLVLTNLAKRACADPSCLAGSPRFEPTRIGKHPCLLTRVTIAAPPFPPAAGATTPLELALLIPKAPMNLNGPAVVAAWEKLVPPADRLDPSPEGETEEATAEPAAASPTAAPLPNRTRRKSPPPPRRRRHPGQDLLRLVTLQDDLDLAPSTVKYQPGGGPRGHNGVRSVSSALTSTRYHRVWVGIGRPGPKRSAAGHGGVADYVLAPMEREHVRRCEFDEGTGKGGDVLERVWQEVLRIGFGAFELPPRRPSAQ